MHKMRFEKSSCGNKI